MSRRTSGKDLRPIVVVLGVHRAGTSLTTKMLQLMGVRLGENLIAGRPENPMGFFEHAGLVGGIKSIEEIIQRRPFRPAGLLPFPEGWLDRDDVQEVRQQLAGILKAEVEAAGDGIFGFKDPRTCRFLPLWQQIFKELQLEPRYLLALREPRAVVRSNIARTRLTPAEAQLLCVWHYIDAVRYTDGHFAAVADFGRWFESPMEQATEIAEGLALGDLFDPPRFAAALSEFIRPDLDHSRRDDDDIPLHPFLVNLHHALLASHRDRRALRMVKTLTAQFMAIQDLVQPWRLASEEQDVLLSWLADANRLAGRLQERIKQMKNETRAQEPDAAAAGEDEPELQSLRRQLEALRGEYEGRLGNLQFDVARLEQDNRLLQDACRRHEALQREAADVPATDHQPDVAGIRGERRRRAERLASGGLRPGGRRNGAGTKPGPG